VSPPTRHSILFPISLVDVPTNNLCEIGFGIIINLAKRMFNDQKIYFTTATILKWLNLFERDEYKDVLISSLRHLIQNERLYVYAFVIMPNHLHIIWSENIRKTKETVKTSFFKFTSKQFLKGLKQANPVFLKKFYVDKSDRKYQFWQRDSLDIEIYSEKIFEQKLNYIHDNPLQPKWNLVEKPVEYKYSSVKFYEEGIDEFGILTSYYLV
jgi:REP element-mobilizing transposase RayT